MHRHHVDDRQAERGEAPGQAERQQHRQHQLAGGAHQRGQLRRQQRHVVLVVEQRERGVPVAQLGQAGAEEDLADVQARGQLGQRLQRLERGDGALRQ